MSNPIPQEIPIPEEFQKALWAASIDHAKVLDSEYREQAEQDFEDGGQWAYRHLHTQSVGGPHWVNADVINPDKADEYYCEYWVSLSSKWGRKLFYWNGTQWLSGPYKIERWLSESPSLSALKEEPSDMAKEAAVISAHSLETVLEKEEEKDRYLKFKCAGHQKGGDFFQIYMEDEDSGKRYVTEFNGAFGRILFDKELVRKAAQVRKVLEILLEGYSEYWPGYITDKVNDAIDNAKTWMEPEPPAPSLPIEEKEPSTTTPGEQEVPAEIMQWIQNSAKKFCRLSDTKPDIVVTHKDYSLAGLLAWHDGAKAMYHKMENELKDLLEVAEHEHAVTKDYYKLQVQLEAQLSEANAKIKNLEDWIRSH